MKYVIGGGLVALLLYYLNKNQTAAQATVTTIGNAPAAPVYPPELGAPLGATGARVCCGTATQVASPGVPPSPGIGGAPLPVVSGTGDRLIPPIRSVGSPILQRPPIIFQQGPSVSVPVTQSPAVPAAPQPAPRTPVPVRIAPALPIFRPTLGSPTTREKYLA